MYPIEYSVPARVSGGVSEPEYLEHLESHGRRVLNGSRAFKLELSKIRQDRALRSFGIRTPGMPSVTACPRSMFHTTRSGPSI